MATASGRAPCKVRTTWQVSAQPWSLPWLALVETSQREQDLTSLTPKRGLIAAQAVEGIGRQVGQADKRAGDIVALSSGFLGRFYARIRPVCSSTFFSIPTLVAMASR